MEIQVPRRMAAPLGRGDAAMGETRSGTKTMEPSLTAVGSVWTTVEHDMLMSMLPEVAVKTM